jgi:hypothetical protein
VLKTWIEKTFHFAEQPLELKLKVLSYAEAPPFLKQMDVFRKGSYDEAFEKLDSAFAGEVFKKWVRLQSPVELDDGGRIETGQALFQIANPGLVWDVLGELYKLASLTVAEGKASSSPSTSSAETVSGVAASDSPATSTGGEGGISA